MGKLKGIDQSEGDMEEFKVSNRTEFDQWQDLQRRFKVSMAEFEAELARTHTNECKRRIGKCRICIFKQKIVLLEEEFTKIMEKMEVA